MNAERVADFLHAKRVGRGWLAHCPAHDDRRASLSIGEGRDGQVLLKCFAGCKTEDILRAAGLSWADLFPSDNRKPQAQAKPKETQVKATDLPPLTWWAWYCDVPPEFLETLPVREEGDCIIFRFGEGLAEKCRRAGTKDIFWRPEGAPTPSLWPLPEATLPSMIWLTEGESDCIVLRLAGLAAHATTKGAGWTPKPDEVDALKRRGVKRVNIVFDADDAGRTGARKLAQALADGGLDVRIVDLVQAGLLDSLLGLKDVRDLWRTGPDYDWTDRLERAANEAEPVKPRAAASLQQQEQQGAVRCLTLGELARLAGETNWLWRGWLARGTVTVLAGMQGVGKTTLSLALGAILERGGKWPDGSEAPKGKVLYVPSEGADSEIGEKALRVGADIAAVLTHPDGSYMTVARDYDAILEHALQGGYDYIVLDSMTGHALSDLRKSEKAREFMNKLSELARLTNAAVLVLHHLRKRGVMDLGEGITQDRVRDSQDILAAARMAWGLEEKEDGSLLLEVIKSNLAAKPQGLRLVIDDDGVTALGVMEEKSLDGAAGWERAAAWLKNLLKDGPREPREVQMLAQAAGITPKQLRLARDKVVQGFKRVGRGKALWALTQAELDAHLEGQETITCPSRKEEGQERQERQERQEKDYMPYMPFLPLNVTGPQKEGKNGLGADDEPQKPSGNGHDGDDGLADLLAEHPFLALFTKQKQEVAT